MIQAFAALARRMAELERRVDNAQHFGTVDEVDPARQMVRLDLGDGLRSPWAPYGQSAGALKIHAPPTIGQQMALFSPSGDLAQGVATPLSFTAGEPSPSSAGDINTLTFGEIRIDLAEDALTITAGGVVVTLSAAGLAITGGSVRHDGMNIGANHRHGGVDRGDGNTDPPNP